MAWKRLPYSAFWLLVCSNVCSSKHKIIGQQISDQVAKSFLGFGPRLDAPSITSGIHMLGGTQHQPLALWQSEEWDQQSLTNRYQSQGLFSEIKASVLCTKEISGSYFATQEGLIQQTKMMIYIGGREARRGLGLRVHARPYLCDDLSSCPSTFGVQNGPASLMDKNLFCPSSSTVSYSSVVPFISYIPSPSAPNPCLAQLLAGWLEASSCSRACEHDSNLKVSRNRLVDSKETDRPSFTSVHIFWRHELEWPSCYRIMGYFKGKKYWWKSIRKKMYEV